MSFDALAPRRGQETYELATWGVRAVAFLIDQLILTAVIGAAFGIAFATDSDTDDPQGLLREVVFAVGVPLGLLYAPLLLARDGARNGQTLGKQVMRIRVVRENGEPVTLGNAIMRETIGRQLIAAFTYGLYLLVDYAWPLWDGARQALHDKVAQTRVTRVEARPGMPGGSFTVAPAETAPELAETAPPPEPAPREERPVRDGWLPPRAER